MSGYWSETDPYCWPGTTVLRNKLGIMDSAELDRAERVIVRTRSQSALPPGLSRNDLCALHRHLFGDLYEWAGSLRSVRLAKANSVFCFPEYIGESLDRLLAELAMQVQTPIKTADGAAHVAAWLLHGLNCIHPFRDGNGRTQALFTVMALRRTSWTIDYSALETEQFLSAMVEAFQTDNSNPIHAALLGVIAPTD